jgi:hypothetical protein
MRLAEGFEHFQLARFNDGDGLRTFDRRESDQKIFNGFAAFKGVDQILQRNTGSDKNRRAPPIISGSARQMVEGSLFPETGQNVTVRKSAQLKP